MSEVLAEDSQGTTVVIQEYPASTLITLDEYINRALPYHIQKQLRNVDTDEVKSICKSVFVTFDASAGKSIEIPSEWKAAISQFEQASF